MITSSHEVGVISVIVCVFNEENRIAQCVDSLLGQNYPATQFEIIIIDDGSTDRTQEICYETANSVACPTIRYVRIEHAGLSVARNTGIYLANGGIVAFIDGDAIADSDWLKTLSGLFKADPNLLIASGRVENLNNESKFASWIHKAHFRAALLASSVRVTGTNMAYSKHVFDELFGFFDAFDRRGDESALVAMFLRSKWNSKSEALVEYSDSAVVYNEHPESVFHWLGLQWLEGQLTLLIEKDFEFASKFSLATRCLCRLGSLGFYAGLPLWISHLTPMPLIVGTTLFGCWLGRLSYRYKYFFNCWREVTGSFGMALGIGAIAIVVLGLISRDVGYCLSYAKNPLLKRRSYSQSIGTIIDDSSEERHGERRTKAR